MGGFYIFLITENLNPFAYTLFYQGVPSKQNSNRNFLTQKITTTK